MLNWILFTGSHFTEGILGFHCLCFGFLLQQPRGRSISEWPVPTHLLGSLPSSPFTSLTTSWHHWSFWSSSQNGVPAAWLCCSANKQNWMSSSAPVKRCSEDWLAVLLGQPALWHHSSTLKENNTYIPPNSTGRHMKGQCTAVFQSVSCA